MLTIGQMDAIYGCARLTIVAAAGSDAEAGLPGIRPGGRSLQRKVCLADGVTLSDILPPLKEAVDDSIWNTRGWTYQERILSSRKLYFTAYQTFYECSHGLNYEDNLYDVHSVGATFSVPEDDDSPGREPEDKYQLWQPGVLNYAVYEGTVREFTARALSYEEDVEAAFQGVSRALADRLFNKSPLIFGIPLCCIHFALLWYPSGRLQRRRRRSPPLESSPLHSPLYFLSWSWMGWKGKLRLESLGNVSETIISSVEWLDADGGGIARVPEALTGSPPSSWMGWPEWTHHVDQHGFGFYTAETVRDGKQRFCHPIPAFEPQDPTPVSWEAGLLFMRAEVARLTISSAHTGRWDQEPSCESGDHASGTCQLWIRDDSGVRAGIVYVSGTWFLDKGLSSAGQELEFVKLSQQTYSILDSDPSWDEDTGTYRGTPGSPAINPQEALHADEESFDQTVYNRNICWCLCNVLLIEWDDGIAYRMGVGQVHTHAFENARPERRIITLG